MAGRKALIPGPMAMDIGSSHHSRSTRESRDSRESGGNRGSRDKKPRRLPSQTPQQQCPSPAGACDLGSALQAGKSAVHRAMELQQTTMLPCQTDIEQLCWEDVLVEDLLGVGGFASVCLVSCPKLKRKLGKGHNKMPEEGSGSISFDASCLPSDGSFASLSGSQMSLESDDSSDGYALKCLSNRTMSRSKQFITGAADLVAEAFLLSRLSHPNIIQLHGVTKGSIAEAFMKKGGYFLVLEALENTLSDQLKSWRGAPVVSMQDFFDRSEGQIAPSVEERLNIAMSVAKGMEYLHSNNVLFRDLKPDNVGFDKDGMVKLFDFGLARETPKDRLPGMAGSMLYLAPEVILQKFNCKASDVYSYGILTWELASLMRPYPEFHHPDQLKKAVMIEGHRPDIRAVTHPVNGLIESCWNMNHAFRPTFPQILRFLEELRDNGRPKKVRSAFTRRSPPSL